MNTDFESFVFPSMAGGSGVGARAIDVTAAGVGAGGGAVAKRGMGGSPMLRAEDAGMAEGGLALGRDVAGKGIAGDAGRGKGRTGFRMGEPPMPRRQHGQTAGNAVRGWLRAAAAVLGGVTAASGVAGVGLGVQSAQAGTEASPTHLTSSTDDIRNYIIRHSNPSPYPGNVPLGGVGDGEANLYGQNGQNQYLVLDSDVVWGVGNQNNYYATTWNRTGILDIEGNGHRITTNTQTHGSLLYFGGLGAARTINIRNVEFVPGSAGTEWGLFNTSADGNALIYDRSLTTFNLGGSTFDGFQRNIRSGFRGASIFHVDDWGSTFTINGEEAGVIFRNNRNILPPDASNVMESTQGGGVISLDAYYSKLYLAGKITFENNYAATWGGAIAAKWDNQKFISEVGSELIFKGNSAYGFGGAIDIFGFGPGEILFKGTVEFIGNYIDNAETKGAPDVFGNERYKRGGAVNVGGNQGTISLTFAERVKFEGNYVVSRVTGNNTNKHAIGGAIAVLNIGDDTGASGGVYTLALQKGGVFEGNYVHAVRADATARGGAIFYDARVQGLGVASAKFTIIGDTLFKDNYAKDTGGAIHMEKGRIELHSTVSTQQGDGGGNIVFKGNMMNVQFVLDTADNIYKPRLDLGTPIPNAIYFNSQLGAYLNLYADEGSKIEFYDPIASDADLQVQVKKSRAGDVIFYDHNSDVQVNTTVQAGFFRLLSSTPGGAAAQYGSLSGSNQSSSFTVMSGGTTTIADGGVLRARVVNINNGGRIYAEGESVFSQGTVQTNNFTISGGSLTYSDGTYRSTGSSLGGYGTLRIVDNVGNLRTLNWSAGNYYINAVDPHTPGGANDSNAVFRFLNSISGPTSGAGTVIVKQGSGIYLVDNPTSDGVTWVPSRNTYIGGTRIDEGTIYLSAVIPSAPSGGNVTYDPARWVSSAGLGSGPITINDGEPILNTPNEPITAETPVIPAVLKIRPTQTFVSNADIVPGANEVGSYTINNSLNKSDTVTRKQNWDVDKKDTDYEAYIQLGDITTPNYGKGLLDIDLAPNLASATHPDNAVGVDVSLNVRNSRPTLTILDSPTVTTRNYNARVLLQNLDYELTAHLNPGAFPTAAARDTSPNKSLANARLELGTGARVIVPAGTNYLGALAFKSVPATDTLNYAGPSYLRFENIGAMSGDPYYNQRSNSRIYASFDGVPQSNRVGAGDLEVSGPGIVQVRQNNSNTTWESGGANNPDGDLASLFENVNSMPLLLRDDYGLPRQLVKADRVTSNSSTSHLELKNFAMNDIVLRGGSFLNQNAVDVAVQRLRVDNESLTFGPNRDGLYIGATLRRLELIKGQTTLFEPGDNDPNINLAAVNRPLAYEFKVAIGDYDGVGQWGAVGTDTTRLYDPSGATAPGTLEIRAGAGNTITLMPLSPDAPRVPVQNTYTGTTHVTSGTLRAWATDGIRSSRQVILESGAVFDAGPYGDSSSPAVRQTLNRLAGSGTVLNNFLPNSSTGVYLHNEGVSASRPAERAGLLGDPDTGSSTFGGRLGGGGDYYKTGAGTLTLTLPNNLVGDPLAASPLANHLGVLGGTVEFAPGASLGWLSDPPPATHPATPVVNATYNNTLLLDASSSGMDVQVVLRTDAASSLQTFLQPDPSVGVASIQLQDSGSNSATLRFVGPDDTVNTHGAGNLSLDGWVWLNGVNTSLDIKTTGVVHVTGYITGGGTVNFSGGDTSSGASAHGILWMDNANAAGNPDAGSIYAQAVHMNSGVLAGKGVVSYITLANGVTLAPGTPVPASGSGYPGGSTGEYMLHNGDADEAGVLHLHPAAGTRLNVNGATISLDIKPGSPDTFSDYISVYGKVDFATTEANKLDIWYLGKFTPEGTYRVLHANDKITIDAAILTAMNADSATNYKITYFDNGSPPQLVSSLGKNPQLKLVEQSPTNNDIVLFFMPSYDKLYWNRDVNVGNNGVWEDFSVTSGEPTQDWLPSRLSGNTVTPRTSNTWFRTGDLVVFNDLQLSGGLARSIAVLGSTTYPPDLAAFVPGVFPHQVRIEDSTNALNDVTPFIFHTNPINIRQGWRDPFRALDSITQTFVFEAWNGQDWKMTEPVQLYVGGHSHAVFWNDVNVSEDIRIQPDGALLPWGSGSEEGRSGELWDAARLQSLTDIPEGVLIQGGIAEFWGDLKVKPYNPYDHTPAGSTTSGGKTLEDIYKAGLGNIPASRVRIEKDGTLYFGGGIDGNGVPLVDAPLATNTAPALRRAATLDAGTVLVLGDLHLGDWANVLSTTNIDTWGDSNRKGRVFFDITNVSDATTATTKPGGIYEFKGTLNGGNGEIWKEGEGHARLLGVNRYSSETIVNKGIFEIGSTGRLAGNSVLTDSAAHYYVHGAGNAFLPAGGYGEIHIANDARFRFSLNYDNGDTAHVTRQVLAGRITSGGTLATIEQNGPATLEISNEMNPYSGKIVVNGGTLKISGRLGVREESFDIYPTSLYPAVYSHAHHGGDIAVNAGGTLEFARNHSGNSIAWDPTTHTAITGGAWRGNSEYQLLQGNLTGGGNIVKTGSAPLIFTGTANTFTGSTTIERGAFTLAPGGGGRIYGTAGAGTFTLGKTGEPGAMLIASAGTTLRSANFSAIGGSILVAPAGYRDGATPVAGLKIEASNTVVIHQNATVVLQLGAGMVGSNRTTTAPALSGTAAKPIVIESGVQLQIVPNYTLNSTDTEIFIADYVSISGNPSGAALGNYFGWASETWSPWEGTTYRLELRGGNQLFLMQTNYTAAIPEPSTYALCGGLGLLALALYRKRRKTNAATKAPLS